MINTRTNPAVHGLYDCRSNMPGDPVVLGNPDCIPMLGAAAARALCEFCVGPFWDHHYCALRAGKVLRYFSHRRAIWRWDRI